MTGFGSTCLLLAGMAQLMSTASAQAGVLDFLFGAPQVQQPVYAPLQAGPRSQPQAIKETKRSKPVAAAADGPSSDVVRGLKTARRLADVAREQGINAAFLQDETLRPGDIVVTPNGLAVYEASSRKANPFRPLGQSRLSHRRDLVQLQRAFILQRFQTVAQDGDSRSPLIIHARGSRSAEFRPDTVNPDVANGNLTTIENLGSPKSGQTATTLSPAGH